MYSSRIAVNCSVPAVSSLEKGQRGEDKENGRVTDVQHRWRWARKIFGEFFGFGLGRNRKQSVDRKEFRARKDSHFQHDLSAIHIDGFPVGIFDGRVVAFDPDILHELGCETAFANPACREAHMLV